MDGCHTEWSKPETQRQTSYNITYMWNPKKLYKWIYLQNRNKVTNVENKLTVTEGERPGKDTLGDWDWHYFMYNNWHYYNKNILIRTYLQHKELIR